MNKVKNIISIFFLLGFFVSCELTDVQEAERKLVGEDELEVTIAKWYNNYPAAISITNDSGIRKSDEEEKVYSLVSKYGLTISYEMVTADIVKDSARIDFIKNDFIKRGFGYFGHGHKHVNHDSLSESEAFESFKKCFDTMLEFGLTPISYAYPGGFGYHIKTQRALKKAGFLAGRKFEKLDFEDPYIMPKEINEPANWYQLPTLVMQAYDYKSCSICINNTAELIPYLDSTLSKNAWLILTYHAIGRNNAYGYYHIDDFEKDLIAINNRNFWVATMDDVVSYSYLRNNSIVKTNIERENNGNIKKISINVEPQIDLPNYNIPITLFIDLSKQSNKVIKLAKTSKTGLIKRVNEDSLLINTKIGELIEISFY